MKQICKVFVLALTIVSTFAPTEAKAEFGMPAPMPAPAPMMQQPRPTTVTRIEQRVTVVQRTHIVNRGGCYSGYCQQYGNRGMYPGYYPYYPPRRHCKRRWGRCRGRGVRVAVNTPWVSVGVNIF